MLKFYSYFVCLGLLIIAGCNKTPSYTPDSGNSTHLYGFQLEKTASNSKLNRFYDGMLLGDTAVHLTVDYGTDITALEPTVLANADSIFPKGKQDFTNPVKYTIWANGKSASFTARIAVSSIQNPSVVAIASGSSHVLALKNDGTLWVCGDNSNGQLGMGDYSSRNKMTQVPIYDVAKVFTGDCSTIAILKDGTAWGTGNIYGQLGLGNTGIVVNFTRQPFLDDAVQMVITFGEMFALKSDGSLWGAGKNNYQILAQGDKAARTSFVKIPITDVKQISGWAWDMMVQKTNGEVWGWGYNFLGELGLGDSTLRTAPVKIPVPPNVNKIFCGSNNSFVLDNAGQVWAVGNNISGQLGLGDQAKHLSFTVLPFFTGKGITDIQPASSNTIFKDGTGNVWTVGANYLGQLGLGIISTIPYSTPVPVNGVIANSISGHSSTVFAFKTDKSLWGWGTNPINVLAVGTDSTYTSSPVQIFK